MCVKETKVLLVSITWSYRQKEKEKEKERKLTLSCIDVNSGGSSSRIQLLISFFGCLHNVYQQVEASQSFNIGSV